MFRIAAPELAPTAACANMLGLEAIIGVTTARRIERTRFAALRLALPGLAFARTAAISTLVPTTVQGNATDAHALRRLFHALVAHCGIAGTAATAGN
jgi:hypothetical protein